MGRGGWAADAVVGAIRKSTPTARKCWSESPKKPVDACFEVSKKEPVEQIYSQIQEELRNQYNLGYTPDRADAAASGYHKIPVAARKKDLVVQARDGYYGEK